MISLDGVATLVDEKKERDHKGPYTTERGVVLKYDKVSSDAVRKAWTAIPVPKPPMIFIQDRGREEPHPHDPGYLNELNQYNAKINLVVRMIYFMRGLTVIKIPEDMPGPESSDWYEGLEEFMDVPKSPMARKAAWLMDYVCNDHEADEITNDLMIYSGFVTEKDVDEAVKSFRNNGVPETDNGLQDSK